jgi:PLP dependent protein
LRRSQGPAWTRAPTRVAAPSDVTSTALAPQPLAERLAAVQARIAATCARAHRDPTSVKLLPVSKTVPTTRLRHALALGLRDFGENRVQELLGKRDEMGSDAARWHLIGHLQTNKVRRIATRIASFHALDSLRVATALDRALFAEGRSLDVLVQVNTAGQPQQYGLPPESLLPFLRELRACQCLKVRGLMTLAIFSADPARVRPCFDRLRVLRDEAREALPEAASLQELSMGMSGDFETAIEAGATILRLGRVLFGDRGVPDSAYWPQAAGTGDGEVGPKILDTATD